MFNAKYRTESSSRNGSNKKKIKELIKQNAILCPFDLHFEVFGFKIIISLRNGLIIHRK